MRPSRASLESSVARTLRARCSLIDLIWLYMMKLLLLYNYKLI